MADFPLELFKRLADRANDPVRRTYMAGARANAQPLDFSALLGDLQKHGAPGAQGLAGALGGLTKLMGGMPAMTLMGPGGPMSTAPSVAQPMAPPPPAADLDEAASILGRPLPAEVKQLYAIGDGGYGPGEGLFPLADLVSCYRDLTDEPYGPKGQDWPKNLLPLFEEDPVLICIDLDNGAMVAWDPEEIEDEDNDEDWARSFKPESPSLVALISDWLQKPTFEEEHRSRGPGPA